MGTYREKVYLAQLWKLKVQDQEFPLVQSPMKASWSSCVRERSLDYPMGSAGNPRSWGPTVSSEVTSPTVLRTFH